MLQKLDRGMIRRKSPAAPASAVRPGASPPGCLNALYVVIFRISGHVSTMCSRTLTSWGGCGAYIPPPIHTQPGATSKYSPAPSCRARPFHGNTAAALVLSRRLVFAEPRVAVDAIERRLRRRDELRRDSWQVLGQLLDDREHRRPYVLFVVVLAAPEPLAIVVALERAQELQRLLGEPGRHRSMIR